MSTALRSGIQLLVISVLATTVVQAEDIPKWIWNPVHKPGAVPPGACHFRGVMFLEKAVTSDLDVAADDAFEAYVNGKRLGRGAGWNHFTRFDITPHLIEGKNVIAIKVINRGRGAAGLAARVVTKSNRKVLLTTDHRWKTYTTAFPKWHWIRFADGNWKSAVELGAYGKTAPWINKSRDTQDRVVVTTDEIPDLRPVPKTTIEPDHIVLAGANEPVKRRPKPLLLRPLEALGLGKKSKQKKTENRSAPPQRKTPPSNAKHSPNRKQGPQPAATRARQSGPMSITNPYVQSHPRPPVRTGRPQKTHRLPQPEITLSTRKVSSETQFTPKDGFSVEPVLGHARTGSIIAATFNEFGQMILSRENGPLVLTVDTNHDGRPDAVRTYCQHVKNCHGVLALSGMVFVIGEGPDGVGLYRLRDADRDGQLEDVTTLAKFHVTKGEHGPHGLVLGPDASIYIVVGNHAVLDGKYSKLSPRRHLYEGDLIPRHEDPGGHANGIRLPAGCILRTDVNGDNFELFASGLRNAYDLAFNRDGQLFTYDSDMESDSGTTWYRPTRVYHVLPGSEFGWRSGWAKWPSYYHDSVPPVAETGRGSPTGLVFYEHNAYPEEYRHAMFLADWSEGRILVGRLNAEGAGFNMETDVFVEGKPLNVTDLDVGPDGLLYFVTGGRGTEGGLYRVKWKDGMATDRPEHEIERALQAPQIQSSWGRQEVAAVRLKLGKEWDSKITEAVLDEGQSPRARVQGLQLMQWIGPIPDEDLLLKLSQDKHHQVRRMAAFLLSATADQERTALRLLQLLEDAHPMVRRQATESLVRANRSVPFDFVAPMLASRDRFEAWSARRLLSLDNPQEWQAESLKVTEVRTFIQAATALMVAWPNRDRALQVVEQTMERIKGYVSDDDFLDLIRVLQLAMLRGELAPADVAEIAPVLSEEFPANHAMMNRELIRLLVNIQATKIKERYLEHLESGLPGPDAVHLAIHLRYLEADWNSDEKVRLFQFLTPSETAGNSVPGYLQNVSLEFGKTLDQDEMSKVLSQADPSSLMEAIMEMPEDLSSEQVTELKGLDQSLTAADEATKRLKVAILAVLARDGKPASMEYLRHVFDTDTSRRLEVTLGLAEKPSGKNWAYLVRSLPILNAELAREMLDTLRGVDQSPRGPEAYDNVIRWGRKLGENGAAKAVALLEHWQGYAPSGEPPPWDEALKAWSNWMTKRFPDYVPPANALDEKSPSKAKPWKYDELLTYLDSSVLSTASVERGKVLFHEAQCANCHRHGTIGESMGPNLTGLARRFRTKEILESIVHPSRVISDQYQAKTLLTEEGQTYTGIVGFGGANELLVLQHDGKKVRVPSESVVETIPSPLSAMPKALLQPYSREQIADLIAFLRTGEQPLVEGPKDTKR